jgi:LysM repeat protein
MKSVAIHRGWLLAGLLVVLFAATACFRSSGVQKMAPTPTGQAADGAESPPTQTGQTMPTPNLTATHWAFQLTQTAVGGQGGPDATTSAPQTTEASGDLQPMSPATALPQQATAEPSAATKVPAVIAPAATATPQPTTAQSSGECTHLIQRGENLFRIAQRYGVSVEALAAANNIADARRINAGQQLVIPNCNAPSQSVGGTGTHVVQAGENLFRIAQRYGVSVDALAAANNITNTGLIFPGQTLTIP